MKRIVIIGLIICLFTGSGISAAFASPSISGMLSQWFNNKTEDAIDDIDKTIDAEVRKHTSQLKRELQPQVNTAKKEIASYTNQQKQKGVDELNAYMDQLLSEKSPDSSIDKEKYSQRLRQIIKQAEEQMNRVQPQMSNKSNMSTKQDDVGINEETNSAINHAKEDKAKNSSTESIKSDDNM